MNLAIFEVGDVVIFGARDGFSFDVIILEVLDVLVPFFSVENGILILFICYRQTPIFRHSFFRKQCFSLKYSC